MSETKKVEKLRERYRRLQAEIATLGLVQSGTLTERMDRRPNAQGEIQERGPYYQWTFKEAGKTRTVNLTRAQAEVWTQAMRNDRKLKKILEAMREVSLRILQETTQGVPPRKRRAKTEGVCD